MTTVTIDVRVLTSALLAARIAHSEAEDALRRAGWRQDALEIEYEIATGSRMAIAGTPDEWVGFYPRRAVGAGVTP